MPALEMEPLKGKGEEGKGGLGLELGAMHPPLIQGLHLESGVFLKRSAAT